MNSGFKSHYFKELSELEAGNFWFRARNRLILWSLHRYAPFMSSFLEIGCGTGFVISSISLEFPLTKLFGSEFLDEGLVYARQRVKRATFTQMDARDITIESAMDVIGIFDVLEHIEEDDEVLTQVHRALVPNGLIFITVPQHQWLWSAVDEYACHIRRYSAKELHHKISNNGFEILYSSSFVSLLLPAMYLSRIFNRNVPNINMKDIAGLNVHPILNKIFDRIMRLELIIIRAGFTLPVGGSRMIVAKKI